MALAQGDPRAHYGPIAAPAKAKSKPKAKAARQHEPAAKKNASAARQKEQPTATKKDQPAAAKKEQPAAAKEKSKSAKAPGKTVPAAPPAKPGLPEFYAAIPLADRIALQRNLIWTGDYNGPIDGAFSDTLVEAVKAYQKRHKSKITGLLSPEERTALAASAQPEQDEIGWRLVEDPVTGARVGIPEKLATRTAPGPSGTRWSSQQGQLQIETFRIDTGATLQAVFEQQKKQRRRRVTHDALRDNSFVILGTQGLKKFYVRAVNGEAEVRGITILYDQAMSGTIDPILRAMSSAFAPLASYVVAGTGTVEAPRRKVEYGTGLVVSPHGHIVTARHVADGCQVIAIPTLGNAERVATAKDSELALLRVHGARGLIPIGWPAAASGHDKLTLIGIADPQAQGGGADITAAPARLAAGSNALEPAPALGFSGAAALDSQGRALGIAVHKSSVVAGAGAPGAALVPLAKIRALLEANDVAPVAGHAGIDHAKAATVRVICVRK